MKKLSALLSLFFCIFIYTNQANANSMCTVNIESLCNQTYKIRVAGTNNVLSNSSGYIGAERMSSSKRSKQEFQVRCQGNNQFALFNNRQYVSAIESTKKMEINRSKARGWERFTLKLSGNRMGIETHYGEYFSAAQRGDRGTVLANRSEIRSWEDFEFLNTSGRVVRLGCQGTQNPDSNNNVSPPSVVPSPPERPSNSSGDVSIQSPANGTTKRLGETIVIRTQANDPDGIRSISLWINNRYYKTDTDAPLNFSINHLKVGQHQIYVRSMDGKFNTLNSRTVRVNIIDDKPASQPQPQPQPISPIRPPVDQNGDIVLPLEVFGPSGTKRSVSFNLNESSNISHVYIRCNACGYHDIDLDKNSSKTKATLRINGQAPIALKHFIENGRVFGNRSIEIIGGEAGYGGIGGGFRTIRFKVPVSGLVRGKNTITFEHKDASSTSMGFRIIDFNFLENGDMNRMVLNDNEFRQDDPTLWTAPLNNRADIEAGRRLWSQNNMLYDRWFDELDGRGNRQGSLNGQLRASCADCHAANGRDLKYFNFSNESIIERAKFHRLSLKQGQQIASYIRSLDQPVVRNAKPWNPTYQPGPGLDRRPVYEWAAGAGVDAILDNDSDMKPYLFPNGTSLNAVRQVVDRYDTLNFRELPINIAMPEWNQWLPIVHPSDAFNVSASAIRSDHKGRNVGQPYFETLYERARNNPNPSTIGGIAIGITEWLRRGLNCQNSGPGSGNPMRGLNGNVLDSIRIPAQTVTRSNCNSLRDSKAVEPHEIAKRGLSAWSSVKMWELIHSNNLEQESLRMRDRICSAGRCIDASEPRGWGADGRNVFDRTPHIVGTGGERNYHTQNAMLGIFETNSWYHLNMILNSGYRKTMPSHFAYTYSHVELLHEKSGIKQGYRFWATMIKQRQLQTNGRYGVEAGLDLRTAQPHIYYGTARRTTSTRTQGSVGQPLWGRLAQAMVEDFVEDANQASASDWAKANQNRKVQPRDSTNFSACGSRCTFDIGQYQGRNTYRVIPLLRDIGVENSAVDDLIDWGKKTWPRGPWDRLRR